MALHLPEDPSGEQFEDLLAATLRAHGYFTESRVRLRKRKHDVLEVDVLATPLGGGPESIFEAKRETPQFPTIFKLYGQRMYLGIPTACLVSLKPIAEQHAATFEKTASEMGVAVCQHGPGGGTLEAVAPVKNELDGRVRNLVIEAGWYGNIARRIAQADFASMTAANRREPPYSTARDYCFAVEGSVFTKTPLGRVERLYDAYRTAGGITGTLVEKIVKDEKVTPKSVWDDVDNTASRLWLQFVEMVEHTARLTIMKNALQHLVTTGSAKVDTMTFSFGGHTGQVPRYFLPERFVRALARLHEHSHGPRIPYCLQFFLEAMGGMISLKDGRDLDLLAAASGIPSNEVLGCLDLYDEMFGREGWSWFHDTRAELRRLKLVPAFTRAIGSYLRTLLFDLDDYDEMFPEMGWLLSRWHNAGYKILQPHLETAPSSGPPAEKHTS